MNGTPAGPGEILVGQDNGLTQQYTTLNTRNNSATTTTVTTNPGNISLSPNGSIALTRGSTVTDRTVRTFDTANTFLLNTDPTSPDRGLPVPGSAMMDVTVNEVMTVQPTQTVVNATGGNLSMDGDFTIGRDDCVIGSASNPCGNAMVRGNSTTLGTVTAGAIQLAPNGSVTTSTLNVTGLGGTTTNGIANTGALSTDTLATTGASTLGGTLTVAGQTATNGLSNTGALSTGTLTTTGASTLGGALTVAGQTATNGLSNTGALSTGTLTTTGASTLGGTLAVAGATTTNGISNTGAISTGTLATTSTAAVGGALSVAGATATNGISNTGAFTTTGPVTLRGVTTVAEQFFVDTNGTAAGERIAVTATGTSLAAPDNSSRVRLTANGVETVGNGASSTLNGSNATLVNDTGHGIAVTATRTTVSGGTSTTNLTLDDSGATFDTNGGPASVRGVADGRGRFDAVNYGQLSMFRTKLARGIASVTAMTNIPHVDQGKKFSFGIGLGGYDEQAAFAAGVSYRVVPNAVIKASVGDGTDSGALNYGIGIGASW